LSPPRPTIVVVISKQVLSSACYANCPAIEGMLKALLMISGLFRYDGDSLGGALVLIAYTHQANNMTAVSSTLQSPSDSADDSASRFVAGKG
jgi:hypothetical protein